MNSQLMNFPDPSIFPEQKTAIAPDQLLDLRGTPCPINFVRTKLQLQQMPAAALLEVWLDPGEPILQVPHSLTMEGYTIEQVADRSEYFALQVRNHAGES
jgi:TusA-related sulfurtransferase